MEHQNQEQYFFTNQKGSTLRININGRTITGYFKTNVGLGIGVQRPVIGVRNK